MALGSTQYQPRGKTISDHHLFVLESASILKLQNIWMDLNKIWHEISKSRTQFYFRLIFYKK
jgi:hypothetical protein